MDDIQHKAIVYLKLIMIKRRNKRNQKFTRFKVWA